MGSEDYFERGCWLLQTKFNISRMVGGEPEGSLVLCLKESLSKCSDDPDLLITHPSTRDNRALDHYQIVPESCRERKCRCLLQCAEPGWACGLLSLCAALLVFADVTHPTPPEHTLRVLCFPHLLCVFTRSEVG